MFLLKPRIKGYLRISPGIFPKILLLKDVQGYPAMRITQKIQNFI